ncbi:sigma-like protein [Streptomyces lancefieldiae]|uniref:Sigma-like protein n=1 Tax=Streptomyces lancefieldiae TaxID=3075520 RepID=A0ABU3AXH8_9ACTN|nr:sigma-like protein [Streptomyces sp. DSM 40712]MDT0614282.1 sigma-like protein [Streptomyces sp. DSM 40712]
MSDNQKDTEVAATGRAVTGEAITTLENPMPAPPKDGGATTLENPMPSGPAKPAITTMGENPMPAPPALDLDGK